MAGRPPTITDELTDQICEHIASGQPLRPFIRSTTGMPGYHTIMDWVVKGDLGIEPYVTFADRYHKSREAGGHAYADKIVELAEEVMVEGANPHAVDKAMKGLMWAAAVFNRRYAAKTKTEVTGRDGAPIQTEEVSGFDLARRIAFFMTTQSNDGT